MSFSVGVSLPGGNVGSASGQGRSQPLHITVDTTQLAVPKVKAGQDLVTSGLSLEKFPKGIPVGRISKVTSPPGAAEPLIYMVPLVNPATLSYLQVLLWSPA